MNCNNSKYRLSDFSSQSVIRCVDNFVRTVDVMNETVMVPSRLLNVEIPEDRKIPDLLRGSSDPYAFYTVLNNMRNNVVWGHSQTDDDDEEIDNRPCENQNSSQWLSAERVKSTTKAPNSTSTTLDLQGSAPAKTESEKRHVRRVSSLSMASVTSSSSDCSERLSDTGDSGVDEEVMEPVAQVTSSLKMHIEGLHNCLSSLSETANFITELYQEEVKV